MLPIDNVDLVVTERCNLRCKYCYVNKKDSDMNFETFKASVEYMLKYGDRKVTVTFFGGEPLMNFDLIREAIPYIKSTCPDRFEDLIIITNGTLLTDDIANFIRDHGMPASVSWDGVVDLQDLQRPSIVGSSFGYLMSNLYLVKKLVPGVKVMVAPYSLDYLMDTVKFFKDNGLHADLTIVRDDIWKKKDIEKLELFMMQLREWYIEEVLSKKIKFNIGLFDLPILDTENNLHNGKRPYSCSAGKYKVAIMSNGDIYPCTRFGSNDRMKLGNVFRESTKQETVNRLPFEIYTSHMFIPCQECNLYEVCNAGCAYSQMYNGEQSILRPLDSICKILKILYRESYKLYHENGFRTPPRRMNRRKEFYKQGDLEEQAAQNAKIGGAF